MPTRAVSASIVAAHNMDMVGKGRVDQVNYVRHDVPVTYFSTGYAQDYHQLTDEPRYVDYEHSARLGRFIHDVMLAIAERRDRPAITGSDPSYPTCGR